MAIRATIWDFGGVLVRTEDQNPRIQLAQQLGVDPAVLYDLVFSGESALRASSGEIVAHSHWENVLAGLKRPLTEMDTIQNAFWSGDHLDLELVDYIRSLRPRYRTALLSNAFSDLRDFISNRYPIVDVFDELIISAEVKLRKPDARIYHLAVDRLGVAPSEAVFVDDFIENIEAARQAGLQAVHFKTPAQARAELDRLLNEA